MQSDGGTGNPPGGRCTGRTKGEQAEEAQASSEAVPIITADPSTVLQAASPVPLELDASDKGGCSTLQDDTTLQGRCRTAFVHVPGGPLGVLSSGGLPPPLCAAEASNDSFSCEPARSAPGLAAVGASP
jgi:hypothetical protein